MSSRSSNLAFEKLLSKKSSLLFSKVKSLGSNNKWSLVQNMIYGGEVVHVILDPPCGVPSPLMGSRVDILISQPCIRASAWQIRTIIMESAGSQHRPPWQRSCGRDLAGKGESGLGTPRPALTSTPKPECLSYYFMPSPTPLIPVGGLIPLPFWRKRNQLGALVNKSPGHNRSVSG